jgi:hypothetical protein
MAFLYILKKVQGEYVDWIRPVKHKGQWRTQNSEHALLTSGST